MTFGFMNKIAMLALCVLMVFTSCQKEDSVSIIETEEILEVGFKMLVNDVEVEMDAVAAYCQDGDTEFLIIANKAENLTLPLQTQNFEENDFVFFTSNSPEGSWSYGGQALGEDITGFPGLLIAFSEAELKIAANNGDVVAGTSTGVLYTFADGNFSNPEELIEYPYEITFVAEIIEESEFCADPPGILPGQPIESSFKMTINGEEIESNAVAAYCQNGNSEHLIIANKEENLTTLFETQNFEENDFVYYTNTSEEGSWSLGTQALGEDITGFSGLLISSSEATLTIESNDGEVVVGSSEGLLLGINNDGEFSIYPYVFEFVAEIIQESTECE